MFVLDVLFLVNLSTEMYKSKILKMLGKVFPDGVYYLIVWRQVLGCRMWLGVSVLTRWELCRA